MSTQSKTLSDKPAAPLGKERHQPTGTIANPVLAQQILDVFDKLFGLHPGFGPAERR